VGAFGDGMNNLRELGLVSVVKRFANSGRPILGVCLGMQLLMSESEEFGVHEGLDIVSGKVARFQPEGSVRHKIPLIGWNSLELPDGDYVKEGMWRGTVLSNLNEGAFMYFLHSYVAVPDDLALRLAITQYGHAWFCSALKQENVTGVQFHPERSGEEGLSIYKSFVFAN
jgi:glutamine amidotransferase